MHDRVVEKYHPQPANWGKRKLTLAQGNGVWEVQFSSNENFEDALKFGQNHDSPTLRGMPASSLRFAGRDSIVVFRDARRFPVWVQKPRGPPKQADLVIAASVTLKAEDAEILQNDGQDGTWVLIIKLRPNAGFKVEPHSTSPNEPHPQDPSHDMLRLWSARDTIETMRYLKLVVQDFEKNNAWQFILAKRGLGSIVPAPTTSSTTTSTTPPPSPPGAEAGDLDDDSSMKAAAENPAATTHRQEIESQDEGMRIDLSEDEGSGGDGANEGEGEATDPFKGVWEFARNMAKP